MDYQLSPEESKLQQDVNDFCQAEIAPRAKMLDGCTREEACVHMRENLEYLARGGCLEPGLAGEAIDLVGIYLAGEDDRKGLPGHVPERPGEHVPVRRGIAALRHGRAEDRNISLPS